MAALIAHSPILIIAVPLLAAFLTPLIGIKSERARNVFVLASLAFTAFLVSALARDISLNGIRLYTLGATSPNLTVPEGFMVPVRIILEVDGMSIFMAIIWTTVAVAATIFSLAHVATETGQNRFYTLVLLMVAGAYGMMFTGDLFNLFVFLEITSISGAALIAFRTRFADTQEGGFKYIVVSAIASLMVLFATGLLYGQYDLLNIAALAKVMQYTTLDKIALALLLIAFTMKTGMIPLHMWFPDSYTVAPASITGMLVITSHACMYAAFRVCFSLFGSNTDTFVLGWILIVFGLLSAFIGVTMAVFQTDVMRFMSYHAISQLGYMWMGVGVGLAVLGNPGALAAYGRDAMAGGIFHILNHALYKPLLFFTGGALFHCTGTRDLTKMGGLAHKMKWTTVLYMIGTLSISGMPPLNGFSSKILIYESVYQFQPILTIVGIIVSIITLASFVKAFHSAFMGAELPIYKQVKEVPVPMLIGMGILAFGIMFVTLFPGQVSQAIIYPGADALIDQSSYVNAVMGGTP
ncbi:MAG: proton-conducting transporter transmembrane domain-containing protein [Dehalococcoidia bacterium]